MQAHRLHLIEQRHPNGFEVDSLQTAVESKTRLQLARFIFSKVEDTSWVC
ncbi:hypothetical protein WQQ_04970 [Hydrocarboniphaga effusa AP103]|uniref:Uncharacterized protein n=1 Tax=Hydrocarboniphaga effusa AP103 TaxID=1172194 RepID=I8T8R8_9GAMM|nr:hypothetical protein WQQ_04970 [Hydrocarboniphaga effusa AP103]